ncbi:hypothetical protein [Tengunoibacter tsumagoiensis]|uniref:Uncharacterized protein n=1 Tax=Tengunoibacter tsumagoiensis TaxID=2014871 RepID=A0A401ZZV4_9CHLR|nr:hypothetical protein [Tengunoibacter tsumagoiensis]GCE12384.1 hypothetical protein KTT_22430 [Tengunoibacter tsumagoiensis]
MQKLDISEGSEGGLQTLPAPKGIGMAVAVDWGLAVQILITPIIALFFSQSTPTSFLTSIPGKLLLLLVSLVIACLPAFLGEMVRRGRNWSRWVQLVFSALLSIAGLVSLLNLFQSASKGNFWPFITETILVIISPLTVWRLSRPSTARWFQNVSVAEASRRHGGRWIYFIALWALIGGILQTIAAMR